MNLQSKALTLLVALLLVTGCGEKRDVSWSALSACVQDYAEKNHGQIMPSLDAAPDRIPGCQQWVIVIPTSRLSMETLDTLATDLLGAVSKADESLGNSASTQHDPTIRETESGTFGWGSGPALMRDAYIHGQGGAVRLITRGVVKDAGGLSGYYPVMQETPPTGRKTLVVHDLMITKWE